MAVTDKIKITPQLANALYVKYTEKQAPLRTCEVLQIIGTHNDKQGHIKEYYLGKTNQQQGELQRFLPVQKISKGKWTFGKPYEKAKVKDVKPRGKDRFSKATKALLLQAVLDTDGDKQWWIIDIAMAVGFIKPTYRDCFLYGHDNTTSSIIKKEIAGIPKERQKFFKKLIYQTNGEILKYVFASLAKQGIITHKLELYGFLPEEGLIVPLDNKEIGEYDKIKEDIGLQYNINKDMAMSPKQWILYISRVAEAVEKAHKDKKFKFEKILSKHHITVIDTESIKVYDALELHALAEKNMREYAKKIYEKVEEKYQNYMEDLSRIQENTKIFGKPRPSAQEELKKFEEEEKIFGNHGEYIRDMNRLIALIIEGKKVGQDVGKA